MSRADPIFGKDDWVLLDRTTLYQGFFRVDKLSLQHRLYQGGWSEPIQRELIMRQAAAAILPYDLDKECIALVEQFRVGATQTRHTPWCLELIAGIADVAGETLEQLACREASEEAGLTLHQLTPINNYLPSPGGSDERLHLFASRCDLSATSGIFGNPEEGENIRLVTVPFNSLPDLLTSGHVDNAAALIALQWFLLQLQGGQSSL